MRMHHLVIISPAHMAEVDIVSLCLTPFKLFFPSCFLSFSEESAPFAPLEWAVLGSPDTTTPVPQPRCQTGAGEVLGKPLYWRPSLTARPVLLVTCFPGEALALLAE